MLAELRMLLKTDSSQETENVKNRLDYRKASIFQSVLLQRANMEYAQRMHEQGLRPYSQTVYYEDDHTYWLVKTFTKEAYKELIMPLLCDDFNMFEIGSDKQKIYIIKKELLSRDKKELFDDFYIRHDDSRVTVRFCTPTAFRQNGEYVIFPDIKLFFQSLMNKCSASTKDMEMFDEEVLEELEKNIRINRYSLKSVLFPLNGIRIPAFVGEVTFHMRGPAVMVNYANLLINFGCYSGVGIKTAMGMGMIQKKGNRN